MDKLKQWIALTVVACLGIMAAGWVLLISPKRGEAAEIRDQAAAQEATNAGLRSKLDVLKAQAKELPKKQADLARVAAKIPDNPGLPALIRALTAASTSAGVEFVSVTPGPPAAVVAAGAVAPVAPAAGAAPVAPAAGAPAPAGSAGSLAAIPVAINVAGGYFEVEQFLAAVENLPRAFRVTNLTIAPGKSPSNKDESTAADGSALLSTITGSVYMAANRPASTPVVAPAK